MKIPKEITGRMETAGNLLSEVFAGDMFAVIVYPRVMLGNAAFITNADKDSMATALEEVVDQLRKADNPEVVDIFGGQGRDN